MNSQTSILYTLIFLICLALLPGISLAEQDFESKIICRPANTPVKEKCKLCDDHGYVNKPVARACRYCKEKGYYTMKVRVDHECKACKGYGQIFLYPKDRRDDSSNRYLVRCRSCSGRGYNTKRDPHKMTCPNCDGRKFTFKKHWKTCQECFGNVAPAPHNQIKN